MLIIGAEDDFTAIGHAEPVYFSKPFVQFRPASVMTSNGLSIIDRLVSALLARDRVESGSST